MEILEEKVSDDVKAALKDVFAQNLGVKLVSLNTLDGFHLSTFCDEQLALEHDKLAAIASTMCAMSTSSSQQLAASDFDITTVETLDGNILFLSTQYQHLNCVLCLATNTSIPLAQARFIAKRLSAEIRS